MSNSSQLNQINSNDSTDDNDDLVDQTIKEINNRMRKYSNERKYFKVMDKNGTEFINHTEETPKQVAYKSFAKLIHDDNTIKSATFYIKECGENSNGKVYAYDVCRIPMKSPS